MKKIEAQAIAPEKSRVIIEYISQILTNTKTVQARMNFVSFKKENQNMCGLNIFVPENGFEKYLDLGITSDHSLILYEQLLNDLLDVFLEHETIGVTKCFSVRSMRENFSGICAVHSSGSQIMINFQSSGKDFMVIIDEYMRRYNAFREDVTNQMQVQSQKSL